MTKQENAVDTYEPGVPVVLQTQSMIEKAMSDPNFDVSKFEKLLELHRDHLDREAAKAFNDAMAMMQPELPIVAKRGEAAGRYRYAKWEDIMREIRPILSRFGFSVTFETSNTDNSVTVTSILRHRDGHHTTSELTLPYDGSGNKNAVQSQGSSVQYGKRYTASALLNLAFEDEDDDGAAGGRKSISTDQLTELQKFIDKKNNEFEGLIDIPQMCKRFRIDSLAELPALQYDLAIAEIKLKVERAKNEQST